MPLGGVFGGCSTPQPWGAAPEEGLVIAARPHGALPYPGLITRHACAADKQDLGFRFGLLGGERCSVSQCWGTAGRQGCTVGGWVPPLRGGGTGGGSLCSSTRLPNTSVRRGGSTKQPPPHQRVLPRVGGGCTFHCMDGAETGAGNSVSGSTPSLLLFKQKKVKKTPFLGQGHDCGLI